MLDNELNILNEIILSRRFQIEITKKPNEEKTLIKLYKPENLEYDLNLNNKTLNKLVSFEQKTFTENGIITSVEPNNIFKLIIKGYKIIISKNRFDVNICARVFQEENLIEELFADNLNDLLFIVDEFSSNHLNISTNNCLNILN